MKRGGDFSSVLKGTCREAGDKPSLLAHSTFLKTQSLLKECTHTF